MNMMLEKIGHRCAFNSHFYFWVFATLFFLQKVKLSKLQWSKWKMKWKKSWGTVSYLWPAASDCPQTRSHLFSRNSSLPPPTTAHFLGWMVGNSPQVCGCAHNLAQASVHGGACEGNFLTRKIPSSTGLSADSFLEMVPKLLLLNFQEQIQIKFKILFHLSFDQSVSAVRALYIEPGLMQKKPLP